MGAWWVGGVCVWGGGEASLGGCVVGGTLGTPACLTGVGGRGGEVVSRWVQGGWRGARVRRAGKRAAAGRGREGERARSPAA